ncbi:MAG: hypothetical protein OXU45_03040, partial [Candidatus Melainabacteria bacterium]|nr:hypothetical protein [Candidatus Melainabacteria bacterium]
IKPKRSPEDEQERNLAQFLVKTINKNREDFTEGVAEKFSIAEVIMGVVLTATRRRLDDLAYLITSLVEYAENMFNIDSKVQRLPKFLKDAFSAVLNLVGRKTPDGQKIDAEKLTLHKEAMIGTMNFFTNIPVLLTSIYRALRAVTEFKEVKRYEPDNLFAKLLLYGAPLANAATMWTSAAGKILPSESMRSLLNNHPFENGNQEKYMDDANAGSNSGVEDKFCGLMSAGLTFTPLIGKWIPRIDSLVENLYAAFISGLSVVNGFKGMVNGFHEAAYKSTAFERKIIKVFEPVKQMISRFFGIHIPARKYFKQVIENPSLDNLNLLSKSFMRS